MENIAQRKIGDIVATNYRTSKVFTAYNIDFCCGGGISLEKACRKNKIDISLIIQDLNAALEKEDSLAYTKLALDELIDAIIQVHHKYVETTVPALLTYLDKLVKVHGERHPELFEINQLFKDGSTALLHHMKKEEMILFPYIKAMVLAKNNDFPLSKPHFGAIDNPILVMEQEHAHEGERFKVIADLTNHYKCPADACQTYKVTYAMLDEFEQDLHKHVHIENNVLFPAARKLFNEFKF